MSAPALVVLNGRAGSGKALSHWPRIQPLLRQALGHLRVLRTDNVAQMQTQLRSAWDEGLRRVVAVGGDGTTFALLNALLPLTARDPQGPPPVFAVLPAGTGNAWARSNGLPLSLPAAARQLIGAQPCPVDLPEALLDGRHAGFLSIASAGVSAEVARRADALPRKRPWTYARLALGALLRSRPQPMRIEVDGSLWREGKFWLAAVANCSSFGSGMRIAPDARVDDGLFDIVLVENAPRAEVLLAFPRVYFGAHKSHPRVHIRRGRALRISGAQLGVEMDGVPHRADEAVFTLRPGRLLMLNGPASAAQSR